MYYWVNQGKTYKEESTGGYLWAPLKSKDNRYLFHWENMKKLRPQDIVFNYKNGFLLGYCIIESESYLFSQPKEFNVDVIWGDEGNMVDAKYYTFKEPIKLSRIYKNIVDLLPSKYSPIVSDGSKVNEGYLFELNKQIGTQLFILANEDIPKNGNVEKEEHGYKVPDITSRKGLVVTRVGQGKYRREILKRWNNKCAINESNVKSILIASHIVPWKDSNNKERLDVDNGILLSPIYDALFDRNYISFNDDGNIILSKFISKKEFSILGINGTEKIENLSVGNKKYLKRHREKLIK